MGFAEKLIGSNGETLMAAINNRENRASKKRKVELNKEEAEDVGDELELGDPFERLGDETIVEILVRVNDEKSRRRCVALNKRMSRIIPLAEPVSIHISPDPWFTDRPPIRNFRYHNVNVVGKLFLSGEYEFPDKFVFNERCYATASGHPSAEEIIHYYIKTASEYLRSRGPAGAPIQHVTVKLPPLCKTVFGGGGLPQQWEPWNLEYSGVRGGLIKSCAVLGEKLYYRHNTDIRIRIRLIHSCIRFGSILRPMVERMVQENETLCRVSIVTECGMGRLHMGPDEISIMRRWIKINNGISPIMNRSWKIRLNMKIWSGGIAGLVIVTDLECKHNTEDVKIVIGSVLNRSGNPKDKKIKKIMKDKNLNKLRRRIMKDKVTLPPCSLQLTNSEWQWN